MTAKLLAWGGKLFLVRYKLGQLQLQRVDVDAEEKKVSLRLCSVHSEDAAAALPVNARLVAAKEVEDAELATCYPVLVFQAAKDAEESTGSALACRKRRRSTEEAQAIAVDDGAASAELSFGCRLFFYILYESEGGTIGLRLLNVLQVPAHNGESGDAAVIGDGNGLQLQVFLTDGPYVLLFERSSQLATLLKLQRVRQEGGSVGFYRCCEKVDISCGVNETSASIEVVSCTYVSDTHSSSCHVLIHAQHLQSSLSIDGKRHIWSTIQTDIEPGHRAARTKSRKCPYLPQFPSTGRRDEMLSKLDQVICCCFISELSGWEFGPLPSGSLICWTCDSGAAPVRAELSVSTLFVTGTTSNTICVYASGILLASFVLPARPAELWCMSENDMDQHYLIGVRCEDVNRSFYMLGFSSNAEHRSMELLLSFNHVGHAYIGDFVQERAASVSTSVQTLLLNDVGGIVGSNSCSNANEGSVDEYLDDGQLVKRSVLITQKATTHEPKLSCHRLRRRDEKKTKHDSRSRKRSRNHEKVAPKGDSADSKSRSFSYIERTQKASSRDRTTETTIDGVENALAASHAQLCKLAASLATRLRNGQQEMERLQMIVIDKISLTCQLNQLIIQQWQKQTTTENHILMSLLSLEEVGTCPPCQGFIDMETVVGTPSPSSVGADAKRLSSSPPSDIRLEQQVTLEQFRVVEYVPSSSLIRVEVVLKNQSDTILENSYAALTAPKGEPMTSQGWACSCSVVPEFPPASSGGGLNKKQSGKARFQLKIQFAPSFTFLRVRKVLQAMLWLHWGGHRKETFSVGNHSPLTSVFALAVAPITFSPESLLDISNATPPKHEIDCNDEDASGQQEQLLFISSGSSLKSWFASSRNEIFNPVSSIVRPTFSLVNIDMRERELMLYEVSQVVASLPSDVYVMYNPLQPQHLRDLQHVLSAMRQEIQAFQRPNLSVAGNAGENGTRLKLRKQASKPAAFVRRAMQQDTDLQVHQFMQALQKRVNFHTMWFV